MSIKYFAGDPSWVNGYEHLPRFFAGNLNGLTTDASILLQAAKDYQTKLLGEPKP